MSKPWAALFEHWGTVLLAIVPLFGFWTGYRELVALDRLPSLDEANYYLWGLQIWQDLSQHQWHAFFRDTYHQQFVPFLGSHLFALGMLIGKPSVETARITNLVAGSASVLALAAMSATIARRQHAMASGLTAAVWGTATMHLMAASHILLDSFALLFTALSLIGAVKMLEDRSPKWAVLCGFSAALTFLTKYNVGILLILSIVLGLALPALREEFMHRRKELLRAVLHPWTLLAVSVALPIGLWLSLSGLRMVAAYMRGHPFPPLGIVENLLFYPKALFQVFFSYGALALLPIGGFLHWTVAGWSDRRGVVAWIYVLVFFCGATVHTQKDPRFMFVAAAIAVSLGAAAIANFVGKQRQLVRLALHGFLLLVAAGSMLAAPRALREQYGSSWPGFSAEREAIVRSALNFYKRNARAGHTMAFLGSGSLDPYGVRVALSDISVPRIAQLELLPYPGFPEYRGWGFSTEKSHRYKELLDGFLQAEPDADVLVAKYSENSPLKGDLYPYMMAWQENYMAALEQAGDWHVAAEEKLPLGLTVMIYRRSEPSEVVRTP